MALDQAARGPERCPRCGGPMYHSEGDEYGCLSCGEHVFTTVPWERALWSQPTLLRPPHDHTLSSDTA